MHSSLHANLVLSFAIWITCISCCLSQLSESATEVTVSLGDSAILKCDARFYTNVLHFVEWYKGRVAVYSKFNGHSAYVHPAFQGRLTELEISNLVIRSVQSGDGGNYTCKVNLIDGDSRVYQQSTILYVLDSPSLRYSPPTYMTGKKGETIKLRCTATGTPTPVLTWSKDGTILESGRRISLYGDYLEISDLEDGDVGRYKCVFTNIYGSAASTTTLVLEGGALITDPPRNDTVSTGESVFFRCQGRASPNNITHTWYKDGINIASISTLSTKSRIDPDGSLVISSVGERDAGVYRCTVSNGLGAPMSAEAHLSVIFTPVVDVNKFKDKIFLALGRVGTIPCPVLGYPPVTNVVWQKTMTDLNLTSPRYGYSKEHSLIIYNVTRTDGGWYTCRPENEKGSGTTSSLITVAVQEPPYFTVRPKQAYNLKVGNSITIPCAAQSNRITQPPISWRKVYGPMPSTDRIMLHPLGNLTIYDVVKEDGGDYECVAEDGDISSVASTELIIENTTPHAPVNVTAVFGHFHIQLNWKPGFNGGYKQTYSVALRETGKATGNWQNLPGYGDPTSYTLYGLTPDTEYEIRILSRNKLGNGMNSDPVIGKTLALPDDFVMPTLPRMLPYSSTSADFLTTIAPTTRKRRYSAGAVGKLPKDDKGDVIFPDIVKPLGPAPGTPDNFSVRHDMTGGIILSWQAPADSAVPILYYRIEYRAADGSIWEKGTPVLSNVTTIRFQPPAHEDPDVKYYFRVRAYGLLSYSDSSDAAIIRYPQASTDEPLGLGAKIGIGIAAFFFVGLVIAILVILCDLKPRKRKNLAPRESEKIGSRGHYTIASQSNNRASEWQSFYPYHGGRFAVNGEADDIYVIENQRGYQNTLASQSHQQDAQGRYLSYNSHPNDEIIAAYDSNSSNRPPHHIGGYTANYSNVNGLLHGYYDARTGTQLSPSIINYPHSGLEAGDTTDGGQSSSGTFIRHKDLYNNNNLTLNSAKSRQTRMSNRLPSRNESQSQHSKYSTTSYNPATSSDPYWFTPYSSSFYQNTLNNNELTSTLSPPISMSYDRDQEIVLKPSLPRHSSMRPSIQVPADDDDMPFDPSLSTVKEDSLGSPALPLHHTYQPDKRNEYINANEYPYTSGWVESQTASPYNNRTPYSGYYNTAYHQGLHDDVIHSRGYHTMAPNVEIRQPGRPVYHHQPVYVRQAVPPPASSIGSSVNEMRAHYNREKLLGTVERVRSGSSRGRRAESFASLSSEQLSPQGAKYASSALPPAYQPSEHYPELVSPVYYNNNNNRSNDGMNNISPVRRPSLRSRHTSPERPFYSGGHPSPYYNNSGLLTSTNYNPPTVRTSLDPSQQASSSNMTSGLGSSWSQSRLDGRRARPSWSQSSAPTPFEYDMSCESSPVVVLPQFTSHSYIGLYGKPKYTTARARTSQIRHPQWSLSHQSKTSYDPTLSLNGYNHQQYQPSHSMEPKLILQAAPSDSVDENYEFDPVLTELEPQDFFHIDSVNDMPETVESETTSSQRASLYAEQQPTPLTPSGADSQRFNRLRHEYYDFIERQNSTSARRRKSLTRLESDIL